MTTVHFTGQQHQKDTILYYCNINGTVYYYNKITDKLTNMQTGKAINRLKLQGDVLRAFHQAWDPAGYAAALKTPPVNEYGLPKACEDPSSPFYYPAKPQGEPAAARLGYVGERYGRHRRGVRTPH